MKKSATPKNFGFLSIDIEGKDFEVLETFPFGEYAPEFITIEHNYEYNVVEKIEKFLESAHAYAHELGVSLEETYNSVKKIKSITAKEWNVEIPPFLRKKDQ